ncbi:IS5 family transposase [[Leptolyngbya] sp. PCC 7376]|uniref:IS5 family transposase n=1 Tax=[Leptolyngbya] sp. PCC 7376 TaxID=111781 RepID=UPI000688A6F6|nr:IS5 family transposase [[Leptolyngbya] sp. PCC 7376]
MCLSYLTDLSDDQWYLIEPLLPEAKSGGRPRSTNLRDVLNAILYVLMGGIAWRLLPHDFPKWQTVYHYFRQWRDDGTWQQINHKLHQWERTTGHDRPHPQAMEWWILSRWIPPQ